MSKLKMAATALVSTLFLSLGIASAARADTTVWNDSSESTPLWYLPNEEANVEEFIPNGHRVQMNCWLDNAGHRWFDVTVFDTGSRGYVAAGPVRDQVVVPPC